MLNHPSFVSEKDYHSQNVFHGGKFLSSHSLITFIDSPAIFEQRINGMMPDKDSDAYRVGRAAHCRILEGKDAYQYKYVFGGPINPKTEKPYGQSTDKYREWKAKHESENREVISDKDDHNIEFMASGVKMHPEACEILRSGKPEQIFREKYCGYDCQIRVDWLRDDMIVDLKTCRDLKRFQYDFSDYHYANQLSFYQKIIEASNGIRLPVMVIAVEKTAPYRAAVYDIKQSVLVAAQIENEDAIDEMRECYRSGYWPTRYEGIQVIGK